MKAILILLLLFGACQKPHYETINRILVEKTHPTPEDYYLHFNNKSTDKVGVAVYEWYKVGDTLPTVIWVE